MTETEKGIPPEISEFLKFVSQFPESHEVDEQYKSREEYWQELVINLQREVEAGRLSSQEFAAIVGSSIAAKEWLSDHDALTGLYNRRGFEESLSREIAEMERTGGNLTLILIDLDGLKDINDFQGHEAGDQALKAVAKAIEESKISGSLLSRIGGDEFGMIVPRITLEEGIKTSNLILDQLREKRLTVSIGFGRWNKGEDSQAFRDRVDREGLYKAKQEGGNKLITVGING